MNLWKEAISVLPEHNKTWGDVIEVRGNDFRISKSNFEELAKVTNYDDDFGAQEVALDLQIIGDGWWLARGEYDGSEWWDYYETLVEEDIPEVVVKTLCCGYHNSHIGWETLAELNRYKKERKNE